MRNTKELKSILSSIYVINRTNSNEDKDITNLLEYIFKRCYNVNSNLLLLYCVGKNKEELMPEIKKLLNEETQFNKENK